MFCFHPKQLPVPNNSRDKKPVKTETTPVAPHAGPQQKVQLQQPLAQPQPPNEVSQGLQVPTVSLYPSQKKVLVKELPPFGKFLHILFRWYMLTSFSGWEIMFILDNLAQGILFLCEYLLIRQQLSATTFCKQCFFYFFRSIY